MNVPVWFFENRTSADILHLLVSDCMIVFWYKKNNLGIKYIFI